MCIRDRNKGVGAKMSFRPVILIFCAAALAACATTPDGTSSVAGTDSIPPAALKPGECGLFGWSADESREFIFFADKKTARFKSADGAVDLVAQSKFPAVDYLDNAGNAVTLRLGQGEAMTGGSRFPQARIVTKTAEGWDRLQPVAIVQSCQPK